MEAAFLKHSCKPNAEFRFIAPNNTRMQVYALEHIDTAKQEVTLCFWRKSATFAERSEYLEVMAEPCDCVRCDIPDHSADDELCKQISSTHEQLVALAERGKSLSKASRDLYVQKAELFERLLGKNNAEKSESLYKAFSIMTNLVEEASKHGVTIEESSKLQLKAYHALKVTHPEVMVFSQNGVFFDPGFE